MSGESLVQALPNDIGAIADLLREMRALFEMEGDIRRPADEWKRRFGTDMRSDLLTLACLAENLTDGTGFFFCDGCEGGQK